jgi:hypothetical protein
MVELIDKIWDVQFANNQIEIEYTTKGSASHKWLRHGVGLPDDATTEVIDKIIEINIPLPNWAGAFLIFVIGSKKSDRTWACKVSTIQPGLHVNVGYEDADLFQRMTDKARTKVLEHFHIMDPYVLEKAEDVRGVRQMAALKGLPHGPEGTIASFLSGIEGKNSAQQSDELKKQAGIQGPAPNRVGMGRRSNRKSRKARRTRRTRRNRKEKTRRREKRTEYN